MFRGFLRAIRAKRGRSQRADATPEGKEVVLGMWKGLDDGYIGYARQLGAVYYSIHPGVWERLGALGKEQQSQLAWEINRAALRPYIEQGVPFKYTLKGIVDADDIEIEKRVVEMIWQGKKETEIVEQLSVHNITSLRTRWRELLELYRAGYQHSFDEVSKAYILINP